MNKIAKWIQNVESEVEVDIGSEIIRWYVYRKCNAWYGLACSLTSTLSSSVPSLTSLADINYKVNPGLNAVNIRDNDQNAISAFNCLTDSIT